MNFGLDDGERDIRDAIRELLQRKVALDVVRRAENGSIDREIWSTIAGAGVFALRPAADPDAGQADFGTTTAAVVFEELGAALVGGPLVGTYLAAGSSAEAAAGEGLVDVIERGTRTVANLSDLDELVVLDRDGIWAVPADQVASARVAHPLDPLTPVFRIGELPQGERIGAADEATAWRRVGATLTAALMVGIAREATDRAAIYARDRMQFGRPIGSFQAVKHLLADMVVRTELARAAAYAAAAVADDPSTGDLAAASATAKVMAGRAAFRNSKSYVQVMGGMGFTWEMPAHLFLKRAVILASEFGSSADHEQALAATL
jgi:alkylation response protein AidB-like acyl-CoA dehydrogenase